MSKLLLVAVLALSVLGCDNGSGDPTVAGDASADSLPPVRLDVGADSLPATKSDALPAADSLVKTERSVSARARRREAEAMARARLVRI